MATTPKKATEHTPDVVQLKCEDLGIKSQDFTPAHAKALLELQASKGYTHWQPVDAPTAE